jgi:hypothetical protein
VPAQFDHLAKLTASSLIHRRCLARLGGDISVNDVTQAHPPLAVNQTRSRAPLSPKPHFRR